MKDRRTFLKTSTIMLSGLPFRDMLNDENTNNPIFGHQEKRYNWQENWTKTIYPKPIVKDCHEMVFTSDRDIILLTNDTRNNIIKLDKSGTVKFAGCNNFPGGHGLTIGGVSGDEFLMVTDTEKHQFFKAKMDGSIIQTWDYPVETGKYTFESEFIPTETAVTEDGEIYVADGYGAQYIIHYDKDGQVKNIFGGRGQSPESLDNAHGICIDKRNGNPTLIITDRNRCCFKRFTLGGEYIGTIPLPGANVCRPVIKGDYLYAAVLTSGNTGNTDSGFVIILDKNDHLISAVAGATPLYIDGKCQPMYQSVKLFRHPHDVLIDDEENLYVCQWNSGQVLPYKFTPYV